MINNQTKINTKSKIERTQTKKKQKLKVANGLRFTNIYKNITGISKKHFKKTFSVNVSSDIFSWMISSDIFSWMISSIYDFTAKYKDHNFTNVIWFSTYMVDATIDTVTKTTWRMMMIFFPEIVDML